MCCDFRSPAPRTSELRKCGNAYNNVLKHMGSKEHWTSFRRRVHGLAFHKAHWLEYTKGNPYGPARADRTMQRHDRKAQARLKKKRTQAVLTVPPPPVPLPGPVVVVDKSITDLAAIIAKSLAQSPTLLAAVNAWLLASSPAAAPAGAHAGAMVGAEAHELLRMPVAHAPAQAVQEAPEHAPEVMAVAEPTEPEVPEVMAVPM